MESYVDMQARHHKEIDALPNLLRLQQRAVR